MSTLQMQRDYDDGTSRTVIIEIDDRDNTVRISVEALLGLLAELGWKVSPDEEGAL